MKGDEGHFEGVGNSSLFYRYWEPDEPARAVLLVVHGLAEHSGRYAEFARFFAGSGIATYAMDHPGHGRSEGQPGHIGRFEDYTKSLASFLDLVRKAHPGVPLILVGHSMGGLIVTEFLREHQAAFAACVLSGPLIRTPQQPSGFALLINRVIATLIPKLGVMQLDANGVSRDPQVVAAYINDPLVFRGKVTARLVAELFKAMQRTLKNARQISLPVLLLHGGLDSLTAPAGSKLLLEAISSPDKHLEIYADLYHEVYNEPEREQVMNDVLQWLNARLEFTRTT